MEKYLGDLLEELDKTSYSRFRSVISKPKCTVGELKEIGIPQGLIEEAYIRGLIKHPEIPLGEPRPLSEGTTLVLDIRGFEYLNQIRIKKAIEDLNDSIDKFSEKSNIAYSELNDSITKFNASSDKTAYILVVLTVILVILTVILASNLPQKFLIAGAFSILGLLIVLYILKKK